MLPKASQLLKIDLFLSFLHFLPFIFLAPVTTMILKFKGLYFFIFLLLISVLELCILNLFDLVLSNAKFHVSLLTRLYMFWALSCRHLKMNFILIIFLARLFWNFIVVLAALMNFLEIILMRKTIIYWCFNRSMNQLQFYNYAEVSQYWT